MSTKRHKKAEKIDSRLDINPAINPFSCLNRLSTILLHSRFMAASVLRNEKVVKELQHVRYYYHFLDGSNPSGTFATKSESDTNGQKIGHI